MDCVFISPSISEKAYQSLAKVYSLNEEGYEILTKNFRCACLVPEEKSK